MINEHTFLSPPAPPHSLNTFGPNRKIQYFVNLYKTVYRVLSRKIETYRCTWSALMDSVAAKLSTILFFSWSCLPAIDGDSAA